MNKKNILELLIAISIGEVIVEETVKKLSQELHEDMEEEIKKIISLYIPEVKN